MTETAPTAEVTVPMRRAQSGFPAICAMTGGPADGAIPLPVGRSLTRWKSPIIRIPLSESMFVKWSRRQNIHIKARGIASLLTAVGVVLAFRAALPAFAVLGVAIAIHLLDLWAERGAQQSRPEVERSGSNVVLRGVHPNFAEAVGQLTDTDT